MDTTVTTTNEHEVQAEAVTEPKPPSPTAGGYPQHTINDPRIRQAGNVVIGDNNGWITQHVYNHRADLSAMLNPILDASHTRKLSLSPPNSECFPGTRKKVLKKIHRWIDSSLLLNNPHIMWIYGYAGCGKSAIALAICKHFADRGRLAASFFFFRGAGDRSNSSRFVTTIASQVAAAIPATAPLIEAAIKANPGLLFTTTTSLGDQFEQLIYQPIDSIKWERLAAPFRRGPYIIALDGLDECGDHEEVAAFIKHLIAFFEKKPFIPLRFLVTSRVESHIHQQLHSSKQVKLLNLIQHTSDADILASLEAIINEHRRSRILACDPSWPSAEDKMRLVKHIGGSYIFMTTLIRLLFDNQLFEGLSPMARLPLVLKERPDFDALYKEIMTPSQHLPQFHAIVSAITLAMEPLSIAQLADLVEVGTVEVVTVLVRLHAIMQVPGDDHTPVTMWHTSIRDFLCSKKRSKSLHATAAHRRWLASRCVSLMDLPDSSIATPTQRYARRFAMSHWLDFVRTTPGSTESFKSELSAFLTHLQTTLPQKYHSVLFACFKRPPQTPTGVTLCKVVTQTTSWEALRPLLKGSTDLTHLFQPDRPTELEVAAGARNWKGVRDLVEAQANVDQLFYGSENGIVTALQAAYYHEEWGLANFLLEHGADPNILSPNLSDPGFSDGTPLAFAVRKKDVRRITRLLELYGADPNVPGGAGGTALRAACHDGSLKIVEVLLKHGADPDLRDPLQNRSPLHRCAWQGDDSCARALLMHRANPNIQDDDGNTPLHDACSWGETNVVECLLEYKADPSIRNGRGLTALQVAHERTQTDVIQALRHRYGVVE